jgi:hypothetical protein
LGAEGKLPHRSACPSLPHFGTQTERSEDSMATAYDEEFRDDEAAA